MTDAKTTRTRRLFTTIAWGAMALAVAGGAMTDMASAAEQRTYGGEDRGASRSQQTERRSDQDRPNFREQTRTRGQMQIGEPPQRVREETRAQPPAMTQVQRAPLSVQYRNQPEQRREAPEVQRAPRDNPVRDPRSTPDDRREFGNDRRNDYRYDQRNDYRTDRRNEQYQRRSDQYDRRDDRRDYRDAQRWDRNDWRRNDRYDWRSYRSRNHEVYRAGRYRVPYYGYSYRRLGVGFTLRSLFFSSSYWIMDPWSYRLPEVYGPYRWVRYYDDVLLVNIYTGQVVDVIYDFFW